jgi:LemA protein
MPIVIAGIALAFIAVLWWIGTGNGFKRRDIKISEAQSGIEVALTKRYDMLTKLLDTTKGYAAHEKEVLYEVVKLRKGMTISEMGGANAQMDALTSRMNVVAESYPELRSSDIFRELQAGIRDAEEHLQAARRLYNSNVSGYNQSIAVFPSSIVASSMHCTPREFFEAEDNKRADVQMKF